MVHGYIKSSWVKHGVCMSWVCSTMCLWKLLSWILVLQLSYIFFCTLLQRNSTYLLSQKLKNNPGLFWEEMGKLVWHFWEEQSPFPIFPGSTTFKHPNPNSWSPNSNYLYFWYLFVDRQIQKTPSSSAGQQDLRERSPCCFFQPSAWLSSNQTPACLLSLSNGISSLRTCSMWDK